MLITLDVINLKVEVPDEDATNLKRAMDVIRIRQKELYDIQARYLDKGADPRDWNKLILDLEDLHRQYDKIVLTVAAYGTKIEG